MQAAKVFTKQNAETGKIELGKTIALRLDEFHSKYPAEDGWSITTTDELTPITFKERDEVGAETGIEVQTVRFRTTIAHNDTIVQTASTLQPILGDKSWECGETNAVSRALSFMGFGPEELSADEKLQQEQMRRLLAGEGKPTTTNVTAIAGAATPSKTAETSKPETSKHDDKFPPPVKPVLSRATEASKVATHSATTNSFGIRDSLWNQTKQRAAVKGVEFPNFTSKEDFEAFRSKLNARPA